MAALAGDLQPPRAGGRDRVHRQPVATCRLRQQRVDRYLLAVQHHEYDHPAVRPVEQERRRGSQPTWALFQSACTHYRIEWEAASPTQDRIRYYLDGVLRATHTRVTLPALNVWISHGSLLATPVLRVSQLSVSPDYAAAGSYTSCVFDAGQTVNWNAVSWYAALPVGTGLTTSVRTSDDQVNWSPWQAVATSSTNPGAPAGRYIQYRLDLSTTRTSRSAPRSPG